MQQLEAVQCFDISNHSLGSWKLWIRSFGETSVLTEKEVTACALKMRKALAIFCFVFLSHLTERHKSWKTQVEQSPTYSPTLKDAAPLVTIRLSYESEGGVLISTKKNRNKKDSRVCRVSINHNYKPLHHTTLRGLFTHRCGKHVRLHNLLWHFFS